MSWKVDGLDKEDVMFLSRTMQPAERNYEIYDKELPTIVEVLTK